MFSKSNGFKARYDATRERLYSIVSSAKEKIGYTNLLAFYVDRINTEPGISKYLVDIVNDSKLDDYASLIIEYLDQFKPDFIGELKSYDKKIEEYINNK